eukprot:COSAG01_NODE_2518_length_7524_cov_2.305724_2_plen_83_part_00
MGGLHLERPNDEFSLSGEGVLGHANPVCVVPGTDLGAVISGGFTVDVRHCNNRLASSGQRSCIGTLRGGVLWPFLVQESMIE